MSQYKGFSSVELRKPQRSSFDLSHEKRISTRMGKLTPVLITEVLPNDTFYGRIEILLKVAPMLWPIFHRLNLYIHTFFVPNRHLWKDWETFITGGRLGGAVEVPPIPPYAPLDVLDTAGQLDVGRLLDYLGYPSTQQGFSSNKSLDMMPVAAAYKVWYDYYRDRNFVDDNTTLPLPSGNIGIAYADICETKYRAWQHDYFTSALPWTQRGAEVLMPLEGSGTPIYKDVSELYMYDYGSETHEFPADQAAMTSGVGVFGLDPPPWQNNIRLDDSFGFAKGGQVVNLEGVDIDASSVSINDLRRAVALQKWLERNALAGSRYNETIMAHYARRTSDARLQRAEYLGGSKAVVQISEVVTTAYSEDASSEVVPPGNMAGRGSVYNNNHQFRYNSEEWGFLVSFCSIMPTSAYMQGLHRMWQQRRTQLDYPWPAFAHLGEQEVYDYEVYLKDENITTNRLGAPVFGYQSRYAEWKFISSSAHGDFRTNLDAWHLVRKFADTPDLGNTFNTFEDALQDRIFAVAESDTMWMYVYNDLKVKRSLPYFGTPML